MGKTNKSDYEKRLEKNRDYFLNYSRNHYKSYSLKFKIDEDAEMIEYLDSMNGKAAPYIKKLIREDYEKKMTKDEDKTEIKESF